MKIDEKLVQNIIEGSEFFLHDKMIAPVLPMRDGRLPPEEAKHGFDSC
jgi:hypothetical protein